MKYDALQKSWGKLESIAWRAGLNDGDYDVNLSLSPEAFDELILDTNWGRVPFTPTLESVEIMMGRSKLIVRPVPALLTPYWHIHVNMPEEG